ncbi:MAG: sensor histidine kinase [Planctomycetota bacterium]|jgi:PAS domain S-box-containing protein
MGIRSKLVITMVSFAFLVGAAPAIYAVGELRRSMHREIESRGQMVTRELARTLGDVHSLLGSINDAGSLHAAAVDQDVLVAYALDADGRILSDGSSRNYDDGVRLPQFDASSMATSRPDTVVVRADDRLLHLTTAVQSPDGVAGYVHVVMGLDRAERLLWQHLKTQGTIFACSMLVGVTLAYLVSSSLSRPIRRILACTTAIKGGNYQVRIRANRRDELGRLATSVTEMASSLRATSVSKRYLDEVLQSMVDSLIVVDTDANIVTVNRSTLELLGFLEEQLVGQPASLVIIDEGYQLSMKRLNHLLGETTQQDHELHYRTSLGQLIPISFSGSPIRDNDGATVGYVCMGKDITERKRAEEERESLNKQLVTTSRQAGMAEVATDVLHNVGNVLNSINISASLVTDIVHNSKATGLTRAVSLLNEHSDDLADFISQDEKGRQLPTYLTQLAEHLALEQSSIGDEIRSLTQNINHIKDIISMQQSYARVAGVIDSVPVREMIDEALRLNESSLKRHRVQVKLDLRAVPDIKTDKHKVLQVLVNLISNAKDAVTENAEDDRVVRLRLFQPDDDPGQVVIEVNDNGHGISPENITQIFKHGFTTKKRGHGFGLHSSALTAKELRGSLTVNSEGTGHGATFTVTLPIEFSEVKR